MEATLLKYPWSSYAAGTIEVAGGWSSFGVLAALATVGVLLALRYWRAAPGRRALWLTGVRVALVVGLLFVLMDPRLVVPSASTARGGIAVLLDDSASMQIAGADGQPRAAALLSAFAPEGGAIAAALKARFDTRFYLVGAGALPLNAADQMSFAGARLDLAAALEDLRADGPLPSAVVLVTDAAPVADPQLERAVLALRAAGVKLHTVKVDGALPTPDLAVVAMDVAQRALRGDSVSVAVEVARAGALDGAASAAVRLEDDGLLLASQSLAFAPGVQLARARLSYRAERIGARRLQVTVAAAPGEVWLGNNVRAALLEVDDARIDVLHYEAEPRFEVKFVRRAAGADPNLRVVSLVRTAENKFYRLGVERAEDLADGFPRDPEVLFDYEAVVLGSVGAGDLDAAQLQALLAFVERRGGGLLALGGRRALAEGGLGEGPLAPLLPVYLDAPSPGFRTRVTVSATRAGALHEVAGLALGTSSSLPFERLPPLAVVNPITALKPGGILLLTGRPEDAGGRSLVVLGAQRYGRGRVAVLPVRDTWRWQMHASVPLEDQSHELLWRRLLRYLGREAPARLSLHATPRTAAPGQPLTLEAEVLDAQYRPVGAAQLQLAVRVGDGVEVPEAVTWEALGAGRYRTRTVAPAAGVATFSVRASLAEAPRPAAPAGAGAASLQPPAQAPADADAEPERGGQSDAGPRPPASVELLQEAAVMVIASGREFDGLRPPYDGEQEQAASGLQRLAALTGGRYFDADLEALPDAIEVRPMDDGTRERLPLHDVPALLALLLALVCAEWLLRRRWSLA